MVHFHATQKLLNIARINPVLYTSEPSAGQLMHDWYVALVGSGFPGKMLLLYVHQPSLLAVVVKGKTIATTFEDFRKQLRDLLTRHQFPSAFIETEMKFCQEYVIGKTNSKSMLAHINQMIIQVTWYNRLNFISYDEIDPMTHENLFMRWMYKPHGAKDYERPGEYWLKRITTL